MVSNPLKSYHLQTVSKRRVNRLPTPIMNTTDIDTDCFQTAVVYRRATHHENSVFCEKFMCFIVIRPVKNA